MWDYKSKKELFKLKLELQRDERQVGGKYEINTAAERIKISSC